jgi:spore coat polysaccharide biosynthesis protein SpsF
MGSTRLPGKVLADLDGAPVLARVVDRTARATSLSAVVVATSTLPADDVIVDLCRARGWPVHRGSEADVLGRYHETAVAHEADAVVRITADNPMTDPLVVDRHVEVLLDRWDDVEFVTNMAHETFPHGLAVEAFPFATLARLAQLSTTTEQREHVTSLAYERSDLFVVGEVFADDDFSGRRWTVDTPADLEFARRVFRHFGHDRFKWEDAVAAFPPSEP